MGAVKKEALHRRREPVRDECLHDFRHTAVTGAISQGEDIMLIAAFAAHVKTSTTVEVYSRRLPKQAHDAGRRMRSVRPSEPSAAPS